MWRVGDWCLVVVENEGVLEIIRGIKNVGCGICATREVDGHNEDD